MHYRLQCEIFGYESLLADSVILIYAVVNVKKREYLYFIYQETDWELNCISGHLFSGEYFPYKNV